MASGAYVLHSCAKISALGYLSRGVHLMLRSTVSPWIRELFCSQAAHLRFALGAVLEQQEILARNIVKKKEQ